MFTVLAEGSSIVETTIAELARESQVLLFLFDMKFLILTLPIQSYKYSPVAIHLKY